MNATTLAALRKELAKSKAQALLVTSDQARLWATGFASSAGVIVVRKTGVPEFLLDGRYIEKARASVKGLKLSPYKRMAVYLKDKKIASVAMEAEYTTLATVRALEKDGIKVAAYESVPLRNQKTKEEIAKIQKAVDIAAKAFNKLLPTIRPGQTERQIGNRLTALMLEGGAAKNSFDPIVASGENGAFPHHGVSDRKVKDGEFVTIDFGCVYQGYCSDITRTVLVGKTPKGKGVKVQEYYDIVKEAQRLGVAAVKAGVTGKHVDEVARSYIKSKGYDLPHSTGHGLGIDVHEQPSTAPSNEQPLQPGNVVTVEPGIYVPGVGGVRIEDDILVLADGCVNLSRRLAKR